MGSVAVGLHLLTFPCLHGVEAAPVVNIGKLSGGLSLSSSEGDGNGSGGDGGEGGDGRCESRAVV